VHVFTLLGDPVRLRIVEVLAGGEQPVGRIAELVRSRHPVGRSAVSHQLRVLRDDGFVEFRSYGSENRYRLAWNAMDRLDAEVEALFLVWENRVRWPYAVSLESPPERLHRAGRAGLRGRTRDEIENRSAEDDWWPFSD
jgi:DNA-binding transcriptional ArsR family regulator